MLRQTTAILQAGTAVIQQLHMDLVCLHTQCWNSYPVMAYMMSHLFDLFVLCWPCQCDDALFSKMRKMWSRTKDECILVSAPLLKASSGRPERRPQPTQCVHPSLWPLLWANLDKSFKLTFNVSFRVCLFLPLSHALTYFLSPFSSSSSFTIFCIVSCKSFPFQSLSHKHTHTNKCTNGCTRMHRQVRLCSHTAACNYPPQEGI